MTDRAQSESIGVILLTAVVVITVGSAGAVVLAADGGGGEETVNADVSIDIVEDGVVVAHGGGDAVSLADVRVIVETGNGTWRPPVNQSGLENGDGDEQFEEGERWVGERDLDPEALVRVRVIDAESRTLLAEARRYPTQGTSVTPTPAPGATDSSSPTVQVASPDGGEEVLGGGELAVTWTASDNDTGVESIDLQYSADDGTTWATIATNVVNDERHVVRVPRGSTKQALIRVRAIDGAGNVAFDRSNATFTVDDDQPSVDSVSPNASARFGINQSEVDEKDVPVSWVTSDPTTGVADVEVSVHNATTTLTTVGGLNQSGTDNASIPNETLAGNYSVTVRAEDNVSHVVIHREADAIEVIDDIPPNISSFDVRNPTGDLVNVTFESDELLEDINVTLTRAGKRVVMTEDDFNHTGDGPYTYSADYVASKNGKYTATLNVAADKAGNDGGTGQSDTVQLSGGVAENIELQGKGTSAGGSGQASFEVTNTGNTNATIIAIAINNTTSDATAVTKGDILTVGGTIRANETIQIDDDPLGTRVKFTESVEIEVGKTAEFSFDRFQKPKKNGNGLTNLKMGGKSAWITLYLSDGSAVTLEVTFGGSGGNDGGGPPPWAGP